MSYNSPFTGQVIQPTDVSYSAISLTANTQLYWSFDGNGTAVYAARIMDVTPSTTGLVLLMPPGAQASVGQDALIRNKGSVAFTVQDSAGNTIVTVNAGQVWYIYLTDVSTTPGTWGQIAFGSGTSSANAAALSGLGLVPISSTLNQDHPVSAITSAYVFNSADRAQTKIWTGGTGTVTLPASSTLGSWFTIVKNGGTGTLTVNVTGADLIDGQVSKQFQPNDSAFIVSNGAGFYSIGYGTTSNFFFTALTKPITSGTYTLSNTDIQSVIQEYVGTLTGNVIVVYPQVVNIYVVSNQCVAGGYTLTLKTSAAGAVPIIIPAGQQATVVCDGTNFFNANTVQAGITTISLANGTAANPSLSFASESGTGLYRAGAGQLGIAVLGSNAATFSSTGEMVAGTGTFTNGISGGSF